MKYFLVLLLCCMSTQLTVAQQHETPEWYQTPSGWLESEGVHISVASGDTPIMAVVAALGTLSENMRAIFSVEDDVISSISAFQWQDVYVYQEFSTTSAFFESDMDEAPVRIQIRLIADLDDGYFAVDYVFKEDADGYRADVSITERNASFAEVLSYLEDLGLELTTELYPDIAYVKLRVSEEQLPVPLENISVRPIRPY
ncbi:MAG: hypothetical protein JJU41_05190 [Bacteroidetes bacterium]|nr:hypothetical protein [Bacteroidota bacterium]MCH8524975.1 hypothetical protein [Balneolales bacterium]